MTTDTVSAATLRAVSCAVVSAAIHVGGPAHAALRELARQLTAAAEASGSTPARNANEPVRPWCEACHDKGNAPCENCGRGHSESNPSHVCKNRGPGPVEAVTIGSTTICCDAMADELLACVHRYEARNGGVFSERLDPETVSVPKCKTCGVGTVGSELLAGKCSPCWQREAMQPMRGGLFQPPLRLRDLKPGERGRLECGCVVQPDGRGSWALVSEPEKHPGECPRFPKTDAYIMGASVTRLGPETVSVPKAECVNCCGIGELYVRSSSSSSGPACTIPCPACTNAWRPRDYDALRGLEDSVRLEVLCFNKPKKVQRAIFALDEARRK